MSKPQLLSLFSEVQKKWEKNHNRFPQILLAAHLAHSNGVIIQGNSWQCRTKNLLHYLQEEITRTLAVEEETHTTSNPSPSETGHSSWVYWIPVVGSIVTIVDGLRDEDWKELLLGGVFLSLDAWGLSSLARPITSGVISMLSGGERLTANAFRNLKETLFLPEVSLYDLKLKENSYFIANTIVEIPQGYEVTVQAVRQGAQDRFWRDATGKEYPLVYLSNEDRVVAVKSQGGAYREVNWLGEEELTKPLIYRDKVTGKYGAFSLKGGGRAAAQLTPLTPEVIKQSPTVAEVKKILSALLDEHFYFDANYKKNLGRVFTVEGSEKFDVLKFYETAYEKSPIFRAHFNYFMDSKETWKIVVKESPVGSHISYQSKTIVLDSTESLTSTSRRYVGTDYVPLMYQGVTPKIKEAAIHEFLHLCTGFDDLFLAKEEIKKRLVRKLNINPPILESPNKEIRELAVLDKKLGFFVSQYDEAVKKVAAKEQGGIVWLTEKIASQISIQESTVPHRLRYGAFDYRSISPTKINIDELFSRVISINTYLDNLLLESSTLRSEYLLGEKIENRELIKKVKYFLGEVEIASPKESFMERFTARFVTQDEGLKVFFEELYRKSKTFKKIFNYYTQDSRIMGNSLNLISLKLNDPAIAPATIHKVDNAIYFLNDGIQYLSSIGLKDIEKERWFLYRLFEKLTGLSAFDITEKIEQARDEKDLYELIKQRGVAHQLVDQILQEAKFAYPKCLSAAFVKPGDEELRQLLSKQQISLKRTADIEDYYLAQSADDPKYCIGCVKADPVISPPSSDESSIFLWLLGIAGAGITALTFLWTKRFRRIPPAPDPITNIPLLLIKSKAPLTIAALTSQLLPVDAKTDTTELPVKDISAPPTLPTLCERYLPQVSLPGALLWATYFFTKKSTKPAKQKEALKLSTGEAAILAMDLVDDFKALCNQYITASQRENSFNRFILQSAITVSMENKNFAKIYSFLIDQFKKITKHISPQEERKIVALVDKFIDEKIVFRKQDNFFSALKIF